MFFLGGEGSQCPVLACGRKRPYFLQLRCIITNIVLRKALVDAMVNEGFRELKLGEMNVTALLWEYIHATV